MKPPTPVPRIRDYLRIVARYWLIVVGATTLSVGAGWLANQTTDPIYQATSRLVVVAPASAEVFDAYYGHLAAAGRAVSVQQLAKNPQVAKRTIDQLGLHQTPAELIKQMKSKAAKKASMTKVAYFDLNQPVVEKPADFLLLEHDTAWDHPLIRATWPDELRDASIWLHAHRDRLLGIMAALPRTLCHLDFWPSNLLAHDDGTFTRIERAIPVAYQPPATQAGELRTLLRLRDLTLELLAAELSDALGAAGWTISATTGNHTAIRAIGGVAGALNPHSGLRVLGPPADENVIYPLADYPCTARALAEGSAFTAGVDLPGSDPAELQLLHQLGYRALLAVGLFDQERGYLVEIYFDSDPTELVAVAPHARVLAHYCVRNVTAGPHSTRSA